MLNKYNQMEISAIICTKNREKDLMNCINSIKEQILKPNELIIVDDGNIGPNIRKQINNLLKKEKIKFIYIKKEEPGLAASRNIGIKKSTKDIVFFFDDDIILDREYTKNIIKIYKNDKKNRIGGVGGRVITSNKPNFRRKIMGFLKKIFLIEPKRAGVILPSGSGSINLKDFSKNKRVEFLEGYNMSYRRVIFNNFLFDSDFYSDYGLGEDKDFSYRVSKRYHLIITPFAKLIHTKSKKSRINNKKLGVIQILNHYYFFIKNIKKDVKNHSYFWLYAFGICLLNMIYAIKYQECRQRFLGNLKGIIKILNSKNV